MPSDPTDQDLERAREIERVPLPTLREIAVGPVVTTATQAEVESMARELLALRAHGEAAPVACRYKRRFTDDDTWHYSEYPPVATVHGHCWETLYAAPPPEAPGEGCDCPQNHLVRCARYLPAAQRGGEGRDA